MVLMKKTRSNWKKLRAQFNGEVASATLAATIQLEERSRKQGRRIGPKRGGGAGGRDEWGG